MTVEFSSKSDVEFIGFMGGDNSVAMSAWVSFGADDEVRLQDQGKVSGLINFLYKNQHMTPFESSAFTFRVATPIFVVREIQRHRSASYNEWSGRYAEMIPRFYVPDNLRPMTQVGKPGNYTFELGAQHLSDIAGDTIELSSRDSWDAYQSMLNEGIAKEVARMCLPLNIYSQMYVTMNARNLMHFLNLRTAPNALHEIREVAGQMEETFKQKMPLTYKAWEENK